MDQCRNSVLLAIIFATSVYSLGYLPPKKTNIPCNDDKDCLSTPFSFCADNTAYNAGVCSCTREYVLNDKNNQFECLEEAKLFLDPCQIDAQCKSKFGEDAACINNVCKCNPTAHFINLLCWKSSKLGETCGNPNNCVATDFSECTTTCKCVSGYIGNPANTKCLKIAQNLGDTCEDSVQCTSVNPLASCQYNVCLCPAGYTQSGNTCTKPVVAPPPVYQPPAYQPPGRKYNSASGVKESVAMILIALFLFCARI